MWKIIRPILGALLMIAVPYGVYDMISGQDKVRRDMEAIGKIDSLSTNTIKVTRLAKKVDHYITYSFRAHDGEVYSKHYSITPAEFASLREGQKVKVRYHSHNPSINAIPALRQYTSVAELDAVTPTGNPVVRSVMLVLFFFLGGFLIWPTVAANLPQKSGSAAANRNLAGRINTIGGGAAMPAGRAPGFGPSGGTGGFGRRQ